MTFRITRNTPLRGQATWKLLAFLIIALLPMRFAAQTEDINPIVPSHATAQKLAVPAYFYPCTSGATCYWPQLLARLNNAGIVVFNPANGNDTAISEDYRMQLLRLRAQRKALGATTKFIGYVFTNYGNRSAADVKANIDNYYRWYQPDGIFFDEALSTDCSKRDYYLDLKNYVLSKSARAFTVLNPGTATQECYMATADVLVTFEDTFNNYINRVGPAWERNYPASRFWHLVHTTPQASMPVAVSLSKTRNVGYLYVTPDIYINPLADNPWDTLPDLPYWYDELTRLSYAR